MLRELVRRSDLMVILENKLDALVRLHAPRADGLIGHPHQCDTPNNLTPESLSVRMRVWWRFWFLPATSPQFMIRCSRYRPMSHATYDASHSPTQLPPPGLPFSLVFRAEPALSFTVVEIVKGSSRKSSDREEQCVHLPVAAQIGPLPIIFDTEHYFV